MVYQPIRCILTDDRLVAVILDRGRSTCIGPNFVAMSIGAKASILNGDHAHDIWGNCRLCFHCLEFFSFWVQRTCLFRSSKRRKGRLGRLSAVQKKRPRKISASRSGLKVLEVAARHRVAIRLVIESRQLVVGLLLSAIGHCCGRRPSSGCQRTPFFHRSRKVSRPNQVELDERHPDIAKVGATRPSSSPL